MAAYASHHHLSPDYHNNQRLSSSYYLHLHQVSSNFQTEYFVYSQISSAPPTPQYQPQPFDFGPHWDHTTIDHVSRYLLNRADSNSYASWIPNHERGYGPGPNRFSGRATHVDYHHFMPCDDSWVLNGYNRDVTNHQARFSGRHEDSWILNQGGYRPRPNSVPGRVSDVNYHQFMLSWVLNGYNRNVMNHQARFSGGHEDSWILDAREEDEHETLLTDWLDNHVVVYDSADVDDEGLCEETIHRNLKLKDQNGESGDGMCVVCQDCLSSSRGGEKIAGLECGHDFHEGCIARWLAVKNRCPLCKATGIRL